MSEVDDALGAIEAGATADSLESATLDFKREGRFRPDAVKDIAEAAACFANARGGQLVIGVKDRPGGPAAIEGTSLDANLLLRRIYELTTPPLTVEVQQHKRGLTNLLVVRVPRSPDVHQVDNRATRRVGTSCEPMSAIQIAGLLAERRGDDWSAEETGRALTDVSAAAIEQARGLLRASPDPLRRAYATETTEDLLGSWASPRGTALSYVPASYCSANRPINSR